MKVGPIRIMNPIFQFCCFDYQQQQSNFDMTQLRGKQKCQSQRKTKQKAKISLKKYFRSLRKKKHQLQFGSSQSQVKKHLKINFANKIKQNKKQEQKKQNFHSFTLKEKKQGRKYLESQNNSPHKIYFKQKPNVMQFDLSTDFEGKTEFKSSKIEQSYEPFKKIKGIKQQRNQDLIILNKNLSRNFQSSQEKYQVNCQEIINQNHNFFNKKKQIKFISKQYEKLPNQTKSQIGVKFSYENPQIKTNCSEQKFSFFDPLKNEEEGKSKDHQKKHSRNISSINFGQNKQSQNETTCNSYRFAEKTFESLNNTRTYFSSRPKTIESLEDSMSEENSQILERDEDLDMKLHSLGKLKKIDDDRVYSYRQTYTIGNDDELEATLIRGSK